MERELRIGNLVATTDVLIPYHRIEPEDLVSMKDGSFKKLGIDIKSIPLTELMLLKCKGVEKIIIEHDEYSGYEYHLNLCEYSRLLILGDFSYSLECRKIKDNSVGFKSDILETLHQFQNLVFALTNEELEINL
jgi:hypothetical protein